MQIRPSGQDLGYTEIPVLCASEIAEFVFCREAWHLSRQGTPRSMTGASRLLSGSAAHRSIGRRTDKLRSVERMRRLLVWVMVMAFAAIVLYAGGTSTFLRP